jgi:SulP family sulfate permease
MAELRVFGQILQSSPGDRAVLILTFLLTVFVDLSFAIAAGVVMAALVFARNMAGAAEARLVLPFAPEDVDEFADPNRTAMSRTELPAGVEVFRLNGPFFFAAAVEFEELLSRSGGFPKILILRMAGVPLIDSTGAAALKRFIKSANSRGTAIILSELNPQTTSILRNMDIVVPSAANFTASLDVARALLPPSSGKEKN